ncbi:hypothetical protein AB0G02_05860 [Actinosynnema sp. NPDC023658]|uniref:hypothetical protein n=1 Tax=Actinosynnema sp. NPDC023658 TaxID=3155465 RepID=UPI0033C59825
MTELAVVFGLCALSFAAGCVLTAVMLRRDQPPEQAPEPVEDPPAPRFEPRFPPEEYATRPIHRNPVVGIPTALPAPEPARPNLVLVPRPHPATGHAVGRDEVRLHVVRTGAEPETGTGQPEDAAGAEPAGPPGVEEPRSADEVEPVVLTATAGPEPVLVEVPADDPRPERPAGARTGGGPPDVDGSERSGS